uniref:Nucleotid_trans domain-containing protein n=1 Tax=Panagrellus redivivus TaxID=6233 RepID=A0A7E4V3W6_PANRE
MASTLKPHLFFEMMAMFVEASEKRRSRSPSYAWNFDSPSNICAFAMSSQHAYKIVAYLLKNVLKEVADFYNKCVVFNDNSFKLHPLSFHMSESHHIRALMRIAGQYCHAAFDTDVVLFWPAPADWHQPIYEGLSSNEVISSTTALHYPYVIEAVDRSRAVHDSISLPTSHLFLSPKLRYVKNGMVKTLYVNSIRRMHPRFFSSWDGIKIERIVMLDKLGMVLRRDVLHPHCPDKNYLKELHMKQPIVVESVILMLKRHKFLQAIEIRNALFRPPKRFTYEEILAEIQKKTDALWKAIVNHPGTEITVRCTWTFCRFEVPNRLNTVRGILSSEYVSQKEYDFVRCKLMKTVDSKTLEVNFAI